MYQFTTPTIVITIPDDLPVSTITSLVVTIKQNNIKLEKNMLSTVLDPDENTITLTLTQEETGMFAPGESVKVQCHILVGNTAYATNIMKANIFENIHGQVIV